MAVQSSLVRCLRTSTTTFARPMPIRSRLSQLSQRSSYATDNAPSNPKPRTSIFDGMNTTNQPTTPSSSSSASNDIANANAKLSESIANIRKDFQYIKTPVNAPRASREFLKNPSLAAARAQQRAEGDLDNLLSRRAPAARRQQQQQTSSTIDGIASAIDAADPISPPRFRTTPMKLGTKLGRQVLVSADRGIDVAGAIRLVQMNCAVNGIRRQANLQKFHVRRGQRRKDLRSQRWRKLFKFSFDETVKKIQRMRDQGW
ncbi:hypothetical protein TMatcc_007846 [Talaromyces marneffei ATCC 18224]|uniref:Ribosomal protein S21 n=2 Tax=Talaromyces marneffei TaxID=37727 RepID=B6QDB9_TALMQ|nr:uncharacterized protein EYB26_004765 [Talaromyces marneffei]EEA24747.1 conserved hypothetical protein [Talaromyces marneffei ATCC 18224]KAE8552769.1 hypothetical protein EYB25_004148 [Talaromyces marneffei]QGA17095.1 hypothetical protein EYB26_004765 [Talaromyces marneffei]